MVLSIMSADDATKTANGVGYKAIGTVNPGPLVQALFDSTEAQSATAKSLRAFIVGHDKAIYLAAITEDGDTVFDPSAYPSGKPVVFFRTDFAPYYAAAGQAAKPVPFWLTLYHELGHAKQ
jgi:hypothetical protein